LRPWWPLLGLLGGGTVAEACASRSKKLKQHKGLAGMDAIVEAPWQVRLDEEMLTVIYIKRSNQRLNGPGGDLVVESNNDTIDGSHHGFSISFGWRLEPSI